MVFRTLKSFDSNILRNEFPEVELIQLSPGAFSGWIFSVEMENCRVTAGNFSQSVLCEGNYNSETLHLGFIFSPEHSAVVQAHEYDNGTLTIHQNAIALQEVFPPNMTWVDISIPKNKILNVIASFATQKISGESQLFLKGCRYSLTALIQWIDDAFDFPNQLPEESDLFLILNEILFNRVGHLETETPFTSGDPFRMHQVEATHDLVSINYDEVKSLAELCVVTGMKPRTLQKYFKEIYGMGPTKYFRVRRLNNVRRDLLAGSQTVGEVAYRWQFSHLGRFAGQYKTHFGEYPKITLERVAGE